MTREEAVDLIVDLIKEVGTIPESHPDSSMFDLLPDFETFCSCFFWEEWVTPVREQAFGWYLRCNLSDRDIETIFETVDQLLNQHPEIQASMPIERGMQVWTI